MLSHSQSHDDVFSIQDLTLSHIILWMAKRSVRADFHNSVNFNKDNLHTHLSFKKKLVQQTYNIYS